MPRKHRTNSVDGRVIAMQAVLSKPLRSPWPLLDGQQSIWAEIIARRSRDEWHAVDLRFVWRLVQVLSSLRQESVKLAGEDLIVVTDKGGKPNPRFRVVNDLQREAIALSRYLRVHPSSDGRTAEKFFGGRRVEEEARAAIGAIGSDFLARN
jgi:hypothetical protein